MNRTEHLLTQFAEECAEIAQRVSKALRFGLSEVQPGQVFTNAQRIMHEVGDLVAVGEMLDDEGVIESPVDEEQRVAAKKIKVEEYLAYAAKCGTLTP